MNNPTQMENLDDVEQVLWKLHELANIDIDDINSNEFEVLSEDATGRDAYCTLKITEVASEAIKTIQAITKRLKGDV